MVRVNDIAVLGFSPFYTLLVYITKGQQISLTSCLPHPLLPLLPLLPCRPPAARLLWTKFVKHLANYLSLPENRKQESHTHGWGWGGPITTPRDAVLRLASQYAFFQKAITQPDSTCVFLSVLD